MRLAVQRTEFKSQLCCVSLSKILGLSKDNYYNSQHLLHVDYVPGSSYICYLFSHLLIQPKSVE